MRAPARSRSAPHATAWCPRARRARTRRARAGRLLVEVLVAVALCGVLLSAVAGGARGALAQADDAARLARLRAVGSALAEAMRARGCHDVGPGAEAPAGTAPPLPPEGQLLSAAAGVAVHWAPPVGARATGRLRLAMVRSPLAGGDSLRLSLSVAGGCP